MKRTGPYVGVTGVNSLQETVGCWNAFRSAAAKGGYLDTDLKFMLGILVSSKTLAGGTNKWRNRYPPVGRVAEICSLQEPGILNTIHYNTDDKDTLPAQVDQIMGLAPAGMIHALQLNMRWTSTVHLQKIRRRYPDLRVILQIGAGALSDVEEPEDIYLGEALRPYHGLIDDFLVDPSGGLGQELDLWRAFAFVADSDIPSGMQPSVAGGFSAGNVGRVRGLARRLGRPVGVDAEGRLRTPKDETTEPGVILGDHLDKDATGAYIAEAVPVVGEMVKKYAAAA